MLAFEVCHDLTRVPESVFRFGTRIDATDRSREVSGDRHSNLVKDQSLEAVGEFVALSRDQFAGDLPSN
jgi:hypothetical protein